MGYKIMNNLLKKTLLAGTFLLGSSVAVASPINVGGVVWDPDQTWGFPNLTDFTSNGSLIENAVDPGNGITHVIGYGQIDAINSSVNNASSFCPGCELTFVFEMDLVSITPTGNPNEADFVFNNLVIDMYVDHVGQAGFTAYDGTLASAGPGNGVTFLSLVGNGNLTGTGENIGTGSDTGDGDALLDVVGGAAFDNFNTDQELNGADLVFSSSFQPIVDGNGNPTGLLFGTVDISGNTIPEPGSLALLGLGLLGFAASKKRK